MDIATQQQKVVRGKSFHLKPKIQGYRRYLHLPHNKCYEFRCFSGRCTQVELFKDGVSQYYWINNGWIARSEHDDWSGPQEGCG